MLLPCRFPKMISSFSCSTAYAPTCSAAWSATAIASASTSLSARTGSLTSCAASPSVPPTSASLCAIFSADKIAQGLQLLADGDAVTQRDQCGIELLRSIDQPVEFLDALRMHIIGKRRPRRFSGPKRIIRDEQPAATQLRQRRVQSVRVLVLVHVIENQIECARRFLDQLHRILFHLSNDFIARRQQLVKVIVNVILHECTAQIVGSSHSISPGFSA